MGYLRSRPSVPHHFLSSGLNPDNNTAGYFRFRMIFELCTYFYVVIPKLPVIMHPHRGPQVAHYINQQKLNHMYDVINSYVHGSWSWPPTGIRFIWNGASSNMVSAETQSPNAMQCKPKRGFWLLLMLRGQLFYSFNLYFSQYFQKACHSNHINIGLAPHG